MGCIGWSGVELYVVQEFGRLLLKALDSRVGDPLTIVPVRFVRGFHISTPM